VNGRCIAKGKKSRNRLTRRRAELAETLAGLRRR
jgi:hypothetical protein